MEKMCITQLLKTLSFSNTLPVSDSLFFSSNYGLVRLCRAGQERACDSPVLETGTALGDRPACWQCSKKKGTQEPQSCCDTDVLPQIFLGQGFSICILHFPCSYPITEFPYPSLVCYCSTQTEDTFTALIVLYELAGTGIYWNTKW